MIEKNTVYSMTGAGLVPINACVPLPIGQRVSYGDMANHRTAYVVIGEPESYGQPCIHADGSAGKTHVTRNCIEGSGGWKLEDGILDAEALCALKAKHTEAEAARKAEREADAEEQKAKEAAGLAWLEANKPAWAKAVIVAEYRVDESDPMTDYWGSRVTRRVPLAWSKHTRNLFPEMRKAAALFGSTRDMAEAGEDAEHRENYSMGAGTYMSISDRHSTGWKIRKEPIPVAGYYCALYGTPEGLEVIGAQTAQRPGADSAPAACGGASIEKHYHTKHGFDFWIVIPTERVGRETFEALRDACKAAGGWYSRKWGKTPGGFAFKDQAAASEFACNFSADHDLPPEPPRDKPGAGDALRAKADKMTPVIEQKLAPLTQNWTPKRGNQTAIRNHEGRNLERAQMAMWALAAAHDAGTCPPGLARLRNKSEILGMVSTRGTYQGGCYSYHEIYDAFLDDSNSARELRAFVARSMDDETRELARIAAHDMEIQREIDALRGCDIPGFFPTPPAIIEKMLDAAGIQPEHVVLEPSAGIGSIVDALPECASVVCCERHYSLRNILKMKGYTLAEEDDFLEMLAGSSQLYDRIVMNPPFEKGADVKHVALAYSFLKVDGGRLVALMANGAAFQKALPWLEGVGATWETIDDAFKGADAFRNTGVSVNLVTVDRAGF